MQLRASNCRNICKVNLLRAGNIQVRTRLHCPIKLGRNIGMKGFGFSTGLPDQFIIISKPGSVITKRSKKDYSFLIIYLEQVIELQSGIHQLKHAVIIAAYPDNIFPVNEYSFNPGPAILIRN